MKKKVEEVLAIEDFGGKRGAKMDQDDFLQYVHVDVAEHDRGAC